MNELQSDMASVTAPRSPSGFFLKIFLFEVGLGVFAVLVGWVFGRNPLEQLSATALQGWFRLWFEIGVGLLFAIPMVAGLLVLDRYPLGPFRGLKQLTEQHLVPMFVRQNLWQLFLVSLAAGFGEEALYRGLVQAWLADKLQLPFHLVWACILASLIFGACHYLSTTYAVIATAMGLYLGILFASLNSLIAPIVTHALYDFFALAYFVKWKLRHNSEGAE